MKLEPILEELEGVAAKLDVKVSYESLSESVAGGGLCKVKGAYRVIIDKRGTTGEKIATLARALATFDLEPLFLTPGAREIVDRHRETPAGRP